MNSLHAHSFLIPVMGIGFTIDTPIKVAQYGISSVVSLVDDKLMEKMREFHSRQFNLPFEAISDKIEDFRAKRITAYLNTMNDIVKKKIEELKNSAQEKSNEVKKYFDMLPDYSELKKEYLSLIQNHSSVKKIQQWIKNNISAGSIDVNIMTKLDKINFNKNKEQLPAEYNDAHAALRGFAESNLESSIIFSAGLNPGLYSYIEKFKDFYPNENNFIKKKIVLKVSDYRSALIQGKFFAKKGLWVSEYRIESGLNCGGHAFATEGFLMGPILEEFKNNKETLINSTHEILKKALTKKEYYCPKQPIEVKITAQGGVGTAEEHHFLMDYYGLDSVGWGTPFLLVPEAVNVDDNTIDLLSNAKDEDLYLSDISPLNVPFNSLKGNTKDKEKQFLIKEHKPGSNCPKRYLLFNNEFDKTPLCTASRSYQSKKIKELQNQNLNPEEFKQEYDKIVDKSCICVGLGTSALLTNHLDTKVEGEGVSVCPGPNMAYFSGKISLKEMTDHIYGKINLLKERNRPHMFMKELNMYTDYLKKKMSEVKNPFSDKQIKYFGNFQANMTNGINYYKNLFAKNGEKFQNLKADVKAELDKMEKKLSSLKDLLPKKV